jgi:(p)ppGpp synthase/HD superfamily hydrolase
MELIMSLDVTLALTEELDSYTPCIFGAINYEKEGNFSRTRYLVGKILETAQKKFNHTQCEKVIEALRFAATHHKSVYREDGFTPYLLHVLEVACTLIELGVYDYKCLTASIIHDVIEDTEATLKEVKHIFGTSISRIVDLLTKHPNFMRRKFYWRRIKNEKNLHILWRVIVIKFADRIHNLMTLDALPKEKRLKKIQETLKEFPELYGVLVKTMRKLRKEKIFTSDRHSHLPFHLNNRLFYEMQRYSYEQHIVL